MENLPKINASQKISAREIFGSPKFYVALFPHVISLLFVLFGHLGYFYVFLIFFCELIIDVFIISLSVLLTKSHQIQKIYKSNWHKSLLAARTLLGGLALCLLLGLFAFIIFAMTSSEVVTLSAMLTNKMIQLSVGSYLAGKIINLAVNLFRYKSGQQLYIETGKSFVVNLVTLILFVVPGIHLVLLLSIFFKQVQMIAIILLFALRAYIDSTFAVKEKEIEADYNKLYN
jgi:hypothetical protein